MRLRKHHFPHYAISYFGHYIDFQFEKISKNLYRASGLDRFITVVADTAPEAKRKICKQIVEETGTKDHRIMRLRPQAGGPQ